MKNQKITVLTISDSTGTMAPLAGANGELGRLALKSDVDNISAGLGLIIAGSNAALNSVTTVAHQSVDINATYQIVSLTSPTSSTLLFVQGITNRTATSFDVILSSTPTSGFIINWQMITNGTGFVSKAYGVESILGSTNSNIYLNATSQDVKEIILDTSVTIHPPVDMANGQTIIIKFVQGPLGGNIATFDSSYKFPGGTYIVTPAANSVDMIKVTQIGSNYYCSVTQNLS